MSTARKSRSRDSIALATCKQTKSEFQLSRTIHKSATKVDCRLERQTIGAREAIVRRCLRRAKPQPFATKLVHDCNSRRWKFTESDLRFVSRVRLSVALLCFSTRELPQTKKARFEFKLATKLRHSVAFVASKTNSDSNKLRRRTAKELRSSFACRSQLLRANSCGEKLFCLVLFRRQNEM